MSTCPRRSVRLVLWVIVATVTPSASGESVARLPEDVKLNWDMSRAWREATPTRERICLNGLWRWQPAAVKADAVPADGWGYFKVPGSWPGITDYLQKDSQTVYPHPSWKDQKLGEVGAAWYQRELHRPFARIPQLVRGRIRRWKENGCGALSGRRGGPFVGLPAGPEARLESAGGRVAAEGSDAVLQRHRLGQGGQGGGGASRLVR